jgi:hypothetical protein
MYFANFPSIVYDATGNYNFKVVTNLLRRVALRQKIQENTLVFDTFSDKLYGESELHWIILLVNNVTDRYHQWPKSYTQWLSFLEDKYPTVAGASTQLIDQIHHYEIAQTSGDTAVTIDIGTTDTTPDFSATSVTNYEYENKIQEDLARIRLLDPSYIPVFIEEFEKLMEESII